MTNKIGASLLLAACAALGQPAAAPLSFEVASVKPAEPITSKAMAEGGFRLGTQIDGGRVDISFASLADLVRQAYRLKSYQFSGPDWMSSERYDIHAKLPEGATKEQVPEMLQSLLAERFKLTFHRESKEHQVYALVVGKNGPKWKEVEPDPPAANGATGAASTGFTMGGSAVRVTSSGGGGGPAAAEKAAVYARSTDGTTKTSTPGGGGALHLDRKMTMPVFAEFLARFMDRPVIDMTGLTATYQVVMDIPMDELLKMARSNGGNVVVVNGGGAVPVSAGGGDSASEPSNGSAMVGMVQEMGLKLEARKAPMDLLVVNHAEKVPTEN